MPNQVHSTPRIRNHHQIADRSRTPARMVSRRVVDGGASLVIAGPLCSPLLAGPISRPPAGGVVPTCRNSAQDDHHSGWSPSFLPDTSAYKAPTVASKRIASGSTTIVYVDFCL